MPPSPASIAAWPMVGEPLPEAKGLASTNLEEALNRYGPSALPVGGSLLGHIAAIGADVLKFVVSVVIAGFLFVPGPRLAAGARVFAARLVAPRGAQFVDLAGAIIRNVSRGVTGVALLQSLLAGLILYVSGTPGAAFWIGLRALEGRISVSGSGQLPENHLATRWPGRFATSPQAPAGERTGISEALRRAQVKRPKSPRGPARGQKRPPSALETAIAS